MPLILKEKSKEEPLVSACAREHCIPKQSVPQEGPEVSSLILEGSAAGYSARLLQKTRDQGLL